MRVDIEWRPSLHEDNSLGSIEDLQRLELQCVSPVKQSSPKAPPNQVNHSLQKVRF